MLRRFTSSLMIILAAGCTAAPKPVDTAADDRAIRAIDDAWNGYLASQNDSAIAAIYTADAILMPPNSPEVKGTDAIRQFWASLWPIKAELKLTVRDIAISGDLAVETGIYGLRIPGPDAASTINDNGKYIVAWRREGGTWKVVRDIYNSDNPPPPPAK